MWKHPRLLKDFDYIGMHRYFLTWRCDSREPTFTQAGCVDLVRDQILRACNESEFEVITDCFMGDHVHKLVRGRTVTADGRKFIRKAKQYSGFYFKKEFGQRLWRRYGRDDVIGDDEDIRPIAQ